MFYTGKFPLVAPLVEREMKIDLICPLSANPLMTSHGQKCRPLNVLRYNCKDVEIILESETDML